MVERGKKTAFARGDEGYIGYVDDEGFVGADKVRAIVKDIVCCGVSFEEITLECVEHYLPDFAVAVISEIDY